MKANHHSLTFTAPRGLHATPLRVDHAEPRSADPPGERVGSANIAFDDHPNEKRFSDCIETVTVDSVFAWLPRAGLGTAPVTLKP